MPSFTSKSLKVSKVVSSSRLAMGILGLKTKEYVYSNCTRFTYLLKEVFLKQFWKRIKNKTQQTVTDFAHSFRTRYGAAVFVIWAIS